MKQKKAFFAEVAGWYGAIAILLAYFLVSFEFIVAHGVVFQLLNLAGTMGIIMIAFHKNVQQSVVLHIF